MKATGLFFASSVYYTHQKIKHYTFHAVFSLYGQKRYIFTQNLMQRKTYRPHNATFQASEG